ncbi:MAG: molecular chaperone DnaK [Candidatus Magasanikbacteria bacterium]
MSKILGIDLGTTNSAMAVIKDGDPEVLENHEGNRTTPSVVGLNKSDDRVVGDLAKRQKVVNPEKTIFSVKRFIGRRFEDEEVQKLVDKMPYEMREGDKGGVEVKMGDEWYKPEEISAMVLQKLKSDAEEKLGEEIEKAVITVPAYFNDGQRKATKNAGKIAGLEVERIVNEPTAASLAYGLNKEKDEKIVVYDLGGGTFDISVLEVGDDTVEVNATGGNPDLGGNDFDDRIIDYITEEYEKEEGIDLSEDELALQRLKEAAEQAKHELSSAPETEINLPYITSADEEEEPKHLNMTLTRSKLEELTRDLIEESIELTKKTVTEDAPRGAGYDLDEIDEVILVGGQTRMPAINEAVTDLFGMDPHKGINPDEVVAIGAATQAGILQGDVQDVLLLDVTPLTLSIETMGGVATTMIPKNTTIPTSETKTFSTATDNQTSVEIKVLQGEREMAEDNEQLARFVLDGIPPAPRGTPQIDVEFDIDADGILNVSAKDQETGKEQSVRVEGTTSLSEEEVEELRKEAEKHAEEDKKKKELAEAKNKANSLIYSAQKSLDEAEEKVPDEIEEEINDKIEKVEEALEEDDKEVIKKATEDLSQSMQKIGESVYGQKGQKRAQAQTQAQSEAQEENKEDDNQGSQQNEDSSSEENS